MPAQSRLRIGPLDGVTERARECPPHQLELSPLRYLFCAFTTPGLLYPLLGLALDLRRRGHEVAFATGPSAQPILDCVQVPRIPRGERDGDSFRFRRWATSLAAAIDVKHVEYAVQVFGPDVLVANLLALGAHIVGERTGFPLCVMGMATYLWPRHNGRLPWFLAWERRPSPTIMGPLDEVRALFKLPLRHPKRDEDQLPGDIFLLRSVTELERVPESLPAEAGLKPPHDAGAVWQQLCDQMAAEDGCVLYVRHGRTFEDPSFWRSWSRRWSCVRYGSSPSLGGAWAAVLAYSHRSPSYGTAYQRTSPLPTPGPQSQEGIPGGPIDHVPLA